MQEDTRQCQLCGGKIIAQCFDIHTRACSKKFGKSTIKKSTFKSNPMELIPCAECGEMIDFNVFSLHMDECVGRQLTKCPKCKLLYPTFLFQDHCNVCTVFREEENYQYDYVQDIQEQPQEEDDEALGQMIRMLAKNNSKENQEPLTLETINKIKKYTINQSEECSICYCEITKNSAIIKLHCPHKYHTRCLTVWLQKNPHCPMCRRHALY